MNAIKLPLKQGTFLDWEAYDSNDEICFIAFDGAEASPEKTAALVSIVNQRDQLLEALQNLSAAYELLCHATDENPESNAYYCASIAAIAAAKGEV
jgi:hypothetical protein